jgi:hypothetical protein
MDVDALPGCPAGLRRALHEHDARVVRVTDHSPRFHVRLDSPSGPLFGWYSRHPDDAATLQHELAVRAVLGTHDVLRAPAVLAHGPDWRVERMVVPEALAGAEVLGLVVDAWRRLTTLDLPRRGGRRVVGSRAELLVRRARLVLSPLPVADVVRARRLAQASSLPLVTAHGDFHAAHVLPRDGAVWVIDWELSGRAPLGLDLMQLWASLPGVDDRAALLDAALAAVGPDRRAELLRLRYVALVRRIASKVAELRRFGDRDPEAARALLALLPEARAAALGDQARSAPYRP